MATYINTDAIKNGALPYEKLNKAAITKIRQKIIHRPIIVGRSIPKNAIPGDRYYTNSGCIILRLSKEETNKNNGGAVRFRLYKNNEHPFIFKIPQNWAEIAEDLFDGFDFGTYNKAFFKQFITGAPLYAETTSPFVKIENGKLVFRKYSDFNVNELYDGNNEIRVRNFTSITEKYTYDTRKFIIKYRRLNYRRKQPDGFIFQKSIKYVKRKRTDLQRVESNRVFYGRFRIIPMWRKYKASKINKEYVVGRFLISEKDHSKLNKFYIRPIEKTI